MALKLLLHRKQEWPRKVVAVVTASSSLAAMAIAMATTSVVSSDEVKSIRISVVQALEQLILAARH